MNEETLSKMKLMGLYGMYGSFKTTLETKQTEHCSIDQFVAQLIQTEWDERQNRKIERNIKSANFRYKASVENIVYHQERNINQTQIFRLAQQDYIDKVENLLITGSTGSGKSYIASALGHQACLDGYKVMYYNTSKLLSKLKIAKADGTYNREIKKIDRNQLLILDDFGLQQLDNQNRSALLEIIEDRHGRSSTIITSQLPVSKWYDCIGDKTLADAIMDRLVHQSHRIELMGESMRKKRVTT